MWKWVSSGTSIRSCTLRARNDAACGLSTPKVSTSVSESMCPSRAMRSIMSRNVVMSARVESIGKNDTQRPFSCANFVDSTVSSIARSYSQR